MVGIPPENLFYTVFVGLKAIVLAYNMFNMCFLTEASVGACGKISCMVMPL